MILLHDRLSVQDQTLFLVAADLIWEMVASDTDRMDLAHFYFFLSSSLLFNKRIIHRLKNPIKNRKVLKISH